MGTIFEELIRRFNEENNEEAGEHFTPRDVVHLMADLILLPIGPDLQSGTYLLYDGACGTGGMLTVAEERLKELAAEHDKDVSIHLYGQEVNPETYAITKADLLIQGEGDDADNFRLGSTLSQDGFPAREFDFMLSNPPYGKSWKSDLERMGGKGNVRDPRFIVDHASDPEFSMITRSSEGQLMFLVNKLAKMKHDTTLGSRIAEVHNGSSLFTGDAGQGESNIRRWIIENDWLEAIIAQFNNLFGNIEWKDADKIRKVIAEEIPAKVSADKAYQNAMHNSGKENARIEHNKALEKAVVELLSDHTELFKQFYENPSFQQWLSERVFSMTYDAPDDAT
jgi:type I restriction enzyme M protein